MPRQQFFVRLIPPRATFPNGASPEELDLMRRHAAYAKEFFEAGTVLAYGPVFAKDGAFGVYILDVEDESEVHAFMKGDPSVAGGLNTYEISPMHVTGSQPRRP